MGFPSIGLTKLKWLNDKYGNKFYLELDTVKLNNINNLWSVWVLEDLFEPLAHGQFEGKPVYSIRYHYLVACEKKRINQIGKIYHELPKGQGPIRLNTIKGLDRNSWSSSWGDIPGLYDEARISMFNYVCNLASRNTE